MCTHEKVSQKLKTTFLQIVNVSKLYIYGMKDKQIGILKRAGAGQGVINIPIRTPNAVLGTCFLLFPLHLYQDS